MLNDFLRDYGGMIVSTIITAVLGAIGILIRNTYQKLADDKTKRDVVKTCVLAIEQLYKECDGKEKLDLCIQAATDMLEDKGISISPLELRMLIESQVKKMNDIFWKDDSDVQDANDQTEQ